MQQELDKFSTEQEGKRYLDPNVYVQEGDQFIDNLRNVQNQHNAEIQRTSDMLGTYPATQSQMGGLGGDSYFVRSYQTTPSLSLAAQIRATNQAKAFEQAAKNDLEYWSNKYDKLLSEKRKAASNPGNPSNPGTEDPGDLTINTSTGGQDGSFTPASNKGAGYLNIDDRGTYYLSADGKKRYNLRDWAQTDTDFGIGNFYIKPKNVGSGDVVTGQSNKVQYLYYPGAQSQGGGDYYPITSIEDVK